MRKLSIILLSPIFLLDTSRIEAATIDPMPGIYSISGTMISPPCSVTLSANIQYGSMGSVDVTITGGTVAGSPLCSSMSIVPPWTANIPASGLPLLPVNPFSVDFYNVTILTPLAVCANPPGAPVQVIFSNGNPITNASSLFINSMLGACSIQGVLDTSSFTDVNIY